MANGKGARRMKNYEDLIMYQAWLGIKVGRIDKITPNQNVLLKLDLAGQKQNLKDRPHWKKAREA